MPDLCPKGIDLGVKPPAPSCPPTSLDEMEDRRQRDKEKQVSPIYPWDHMRRAARETEEQPHKLLPLKHVLGEIISLSELISHLLIKKYKESRRIWETIQRTQKNILELLKVLLCFMTLLGRM